MATVFEVRDELWEVVAALIPPVKVPERQGRRPVSDRVCFNAIVFVLVTGIARARPARAGLLGHHGVAAPARLAAGRRLEAAARGVA